MEKIVKLWIHESERIYCDRLVSPEHIEKFKEITTMTLKGSFSKYPSIQKFYSKESTESLLFHNFPKGYEGDRYYTNVSFDDTSKWVKEALVAYNENNVEMKLILFGDAIRHVCRITRIITQTGGHALLVGVGGSGKQSLSKLSAFMCEMTPFTMTVSSTYNTENLKDDLKELYTKTGVKEYPIMFMITDSHITDERFLVYINDLLASGEIADLYAEDDKIAIINSLKNKAKNAGSETDQDSVWQFFIRRVKENLHVVLCFSPVGDTFRTRARRFPGLVNSTVINWFQPWPEDALRAVAMSLLDEPLREVDVTDEVLIKNIVDFMPYSFKSAQETASKIFVKERRIVHNTPKSFLELIKLFNSMLVSKRDSLSLDKDTYEMGLSRLIDAEKQVIELEIELIKKNEEVTIQKKEATIIAERIGKEEAKVKIQNDEAKEKERECNEIRAEVTIQKTSANADVQKLKPMVDNAIEKVKQLPEDAVKSVSKLGSPPPGIPEVFYCIMCMFAGVKGFSDNIELTKKKLPKEFSWKNARKMMAKADKFIILLKSFPGQIDDDNVPEKNFKELKQFSQLEALQDLNIMKKKAEAAGAVLEFVQNMIIYYEAMKEMIPKRTALNEATAKLNSAMQELGEVQILVKALNEELAEKKKELYDAEKIRDDAQAEFDRCNGMLDLAKRLVTALGDEKERWGGSIVTLENQLEVVVGDVLISAAFISYCGPFTKPFRIFLMQERIIQFMKERNIPMTENLNHIDFMIDDAIKAEWNNDGLPSDEVSIENGTILVKSARYPLMVDPQL